MFKGQDQRSRQAQRGGEGAGIGTALTQTPVGKVGPRGSVITALCKAEKLETTQYPTPGNF